jgi:hypothetical protein
MGVKIGTTEITDVGKIKLGSTNITKVYQGVNQIWPTTVITSYSYSVKLGTTLTNVCTATTVTVFSDSSTWALGMGLYSDAALTNYLPLVGDNYIVQTINNDIYEIVWDGEPGTSPSYLGNDTGNNCSTLTDVVITACGTNPDGAGVVTLYAYASQAVDTSVSVEIRWTGDLFTQLTGTAIISSGQSIGSVTVSPTLTGENYGSLEILSITPTSSSTQNYIEGSVSGGTCET